MEGQEISRRCQVLAHSGRPCGQPTVSETVPFCAMHLQRTQDTAKESRYLERLPDELKPIFAEHLGSVDIKDLSAEIALARTQLAAISIEIDKNRGDNNEIRIGAEISGRLRDALNTLRGLVESQAKVKPDQVITVYEMQAVIQNIINIFSSALDNLNAKLESLHAYIPADKLAELHDVKDQVIRDVMRHANEETQSRATVVAFGASVSRKT